MIRWKRACATLLLLGGLTPKLWAQAPAAAPAPAAAGATATAASSASGGQTLWKFLGLSKDNIKGCKDKFCASQIGLMTNNFLKPVNALAGGMVPSCCPPVSAADLAKPPDSAEGAAARIKQDELAAKARREAVRYLGTVDCRYWPEAQDGLINALRADRNECVRLEAALALGNGCCCNKSTIKALTLTVNGGKEDGNPAECSERVKAVAFASLQRCLACLPPKAAEQIQEKPKEGEKPEKKDEGKRMKDEKEGENVTDSSFILHTSSLSSLPYYKRVQNVPMPQIVEQAQRALILHPSPALAGERGGVSASVQGGGLAGIQSRPAEGGLVGIVMGAMSSSSRTGTNGPLGAGLSTQPQSITSPALEGGVKRPAPNASVTHESHASGTVPPLERGVSALGGSTYTADRGNEVNKGSSMPSTGETNSPHPALSSRDGGRGLGEGAGAASSSLSPMARFFVSIFKGEQRTTSEQVPIMFSDGGAGFKPATTTPTLPLATESITGTQSIKTVGYREQIVPKSVVSPPTPVRSETMPANLPGTGGDWNELPVRNFQM